HVSEQDGPPAAAYGEEVIEIAADLSRGLGMGIDPEIAELDRRARQQLGLDLTADRQLLLDPRRRGPIARQARVFPPGRCLRGQHAQYSQLLAGVNILAALPAER